MIKKYRRFCKRCGEIFQTEAKFGKICSKCSKTRGRIRRLREKE